MSRSSSTRGSKGIRDNRQVTFRDSVSSGAFVQRRIVLPEGADERVRAAATRIEQLGLGTSSS